MVLAVWFWLFMALALLSGIWLHAPGTSAQPYGPYLGWSNTLLWFLLFLILGIAVFGGPIK